MAASFNISTGLRPEVSRGKTTATLNVWPPPPSTIYAWYKGDVGVTESGGVVSQWDDQSGNNRHLIVPSGFGGPNYISSGINSLPALEFFNGMVLQLPNDGTLITSIVSVVRTSPSVSQYQAIVEASGGGLYAAISGDYFGSYWNTFVSYAQVANSTDYILSVTLDPAYNPGGGTTYGYLNDIQYSAPGNGYQYRANITVGNDPFGSQFLDGYLAELILFTGAPMSTTALEGYIAQMNTKYNIY